MSDVLNPTDVEQAIRTVAERISHAVIECSNAYAEFKQSEFAHDQAFARAYMAYDGPAHARKYAATLATAGEREAMDVADVRYKRYERQARALDTELRAYQSIGASVRQMYATAGTGER